MRSIQLNDKDLYSIKTASAGRKLKVSKKSKMKVIDLKHEQIIKILSKVSDICDYAIENQCTEQSDFEELEEMLNKLAR